jgi:hypothetical protein
MPRKAMTKTTSKTEEVKTEEVKKTESKPEPKKFNPNDGIRCRSVTHGILFVDGLATNMKYTFVDYDYETEITYRDLVALVVARNKAIYNPRIIIMDEDFIAEYPALGKFYKEHFATKNIKEILDMPDYQMKEAISKLPKGAIESLKSIAVNMIVSGEIDSIKRIRALDEAFGTDLSLLNELLSN